MIVWRYTILKKAFPPNDLALSTKRFINLFLSYLNWKFGLNISTKPVILTIEPVKGCNLNCVMCGAGETTKEFLSFDRFKEILKQVDETIFIFLYLWGEPFLSKDITKMIRYASIEKKKIVTVYSNFTVMPNEEELILSEPYEITASIDTFNSKKYEMIRKGAKIQSVEKNLKKLVYAKKRLKKYLPILSINCVVSKETLEDIELTVRKAIELGLDKIKFQELFPFPKKSLTSVPFMQSIEEVKRKYGKEIKIEILPFYGGHPNYFPEGYCFLAYFSSVVDVMGNVSACCMPYQFFNTLANLYFNSEDGSNFGNIFFEERIFMKRKEFLLRFRKSRPYMCSICPLYHVSNS